MNSEVYLLNITTWAKVNYAFAKFFSNAFVWLFLTQIAVSMIVTEFNLQSYSSEPNIYLILYGLPIIVGIYQAVKGLENCNLVNRNNLSEKLLSKYESSINFVVAGNILMLITLSMATYMMMLPSGSASGVGLAPTLILSMLCYISVTNIREVFKTVRKLPNKSSKKDAQKARASS